MAREKAVELGVKPLMKLINICAEGVDPSFMGLGPAVAIPKCLKQAGMTFGDVECGRSMRHSLLSAWVWAEC